MKKLIALSIAASIFTLAASAQIERATETSTQQNRNGGKGERMKIAKELNLTKEQMAQLKENQKAMKAKMEALKANDQITVKEMKEKKEALKAEQKANLQRILTPEQFAKMQEIIKNKKGQGRGHMIGKGKGHDKGKHEADDDLMLIP
jgi:periplasmic protein CpxP/Spy